MVKIQNATYFSLHDWQRAKYYRCTWVTYALERQQTRNVRIPSRPNSDEIPFGDCKVNFYLLPLKCTKLSRSVKIAQVISYLVLDKVVCQILINKLHYMNPSKQWEMTLAKIWSSADAFSLLSERPFLCTFVFSSFFFLTCEDLYCPWFWLVWLNFFSIIFSVSFQFCCMNWDGYRRLLCF